MQSKKKRTVVIVTALVLVLIALLVMIGVFYYKSKIGLLQYSDGTLTQQGSVDETDKELLAESAAMEEALKDLEEKQAIEAEGDIFGDKDVFNILLIGTDDRTKDFSDNARGDTCMLMSINRKTMAVKLVSFERGMGVPILDGAYKGQYDWLTHTFRYGGADLMMREIRECFKIDVHIQEMNVADQIQTVTVGVHHLNGATAMLYARCRYIDNDWHRVERQRNVIQAVVNQTKNLNLLELNSLLDEVLPLVQTNLTEKEITSLVLLAPNYQGITLEQMTIPADGTYGSMKGMGGRSMFSTDFNQNAQILKQFIYEIKSSEVQ